VNLPNCLTVVRIFLTVIFVFLFRIEGSAAKIWALVVFTLASFSDFLDGYLARRHNSITRFGKIMDPIADKFLILSAFFIFTRLRIMPIWMFMVICFREVGVTALRLLAMRSGGALAAEKAGKVKTVLQIVTIYLIMLFIIMTDPRVWPHGWNESMMTAYEARIYHFMQGGIYILMVAVVGITLWSGLTFVWNNRKEIFG
jgi:CDP-diacylglycerol--glycerol-3-phosphate 3-phosphatidyltransferase